MDAAVRTNGEEKAEVEMKSIVLAAVLIGFAIGFVCGASSAVVKADEPLVYTAPICCEVKIPNCYCWPACSDPWPEPPCPTTWNGEPMYERPAGETWPAFCAVEAE